MVVLTSPPRISWTDWRGQAAPVRRAPPLPGEAPWGCGSPLPAPPCGSSRVRGHAPQSTLARDCHPSTPSPSRGAMAASFRDIESYLQAPFGPKLVLFLIWENQDAPAPATDWKVVGWPPRQPPAGEGMNRTPGQFSLKLQGSPLPRE